MSEIIIYGGAFNPPTIGHLEIIKYLVNKFTDKQVVILPTNNFYKSKDIVSFKHRQTMLEIMCKDFLDKIVISNYEETLDKYYGTYFTLKHFNHPYFVMGADSLQTIHTWINYPNVFIENKFIVFPRSNININNVIECNEILSKYRNNIVICDDFDEVLSSSTDYRKNKNEDIITEEVKQYIYRNNLYKE